MPRVISRLEPDRPEEVVVLMPEFVRLELVNLSRRLYEEGRADLAIVVQGLRWRSNGVMYRLLLKPVLLPDSKGERIDVDYMLTLEKYVERKSMGICAWAHLHPFERGHLWISGVDRRTLELIDWVDPGAVLLVLNPVAGEISAWIYDRGKGKERLVEIKGLETSSVALYKDGREEALSSGGVVGGDLAKELEKVRRELAEVHRVLMYSYARLTTIAEAFAELEKRTRRRRRILGLV